MFYFKNTFIFFAIIVCTLGVIRAQQSVSAVTLSGTVTDTHDQIITGAAVSAISLETNQIQTAVTDAQGRFRFAYLPVGNYEIKTAQIGFEPLNRSLTATVGQVLELKLILKVKTVAAEVEVSDATPIIEPGRTQVAETVTPKDVENLP